MTKINSPNPTVSDDKSKKWNERKRLRFLIIFGIILIIFTAVFEEILPNIFFNMGKEAYQQKNYQKAYSMLYIANRLNSYNKDLRYYYAQTLIKLPPTLEVQRELFYLSENKSGDSADLIAQQQLLTWKDQIFYNVGENYIQKAPFNSKILRWDESKFPIKVYIEDDTNGSAPGYYTNEVQRAFLEWQKATSNLIRFKFVSVPADSQILVKIISDNKRQSCKAEECKYVAAFTAPTLNGDFLKKMTITLYDVNAINQPFTARQIYNIVLHEIGHSLGIMGHSENPNDLMYMERRRGNDDSGSTSNYQLISSADLNTLELLYMLIPDITNTPLNKYNTKHQFFSSIVMGSDAEITSQKILEAKNYIASAPNIPNGYLDLAAGYTDQKNYTKAIACLNKALELSSTDSEKFAVYYNLAIIYMNTQDWDNSLKYAQMAKALKSNVSASDIDGLIAAINFNKGNKEFAKQAYQNVLDTNPGSIIDSVNLAKIYLKEFNLSAAGHTLNKLVQANPSAKDDKMVKPFGLLMFFFR